MLENFKVDFNQISYYLWIVVISAIFSIFSIKYSPNYIYYGFITFVYGVIGHVVFSTFDGIDIKNITAKTCIKIALEILTIGAWLYFVIKFK